MKNNFLSKVFGWFGLGLLITFIVAYFTSTNLALLSFIFNSSAYIIILILEIVLAIWLTTRIRKMDSTLTKVLYIAYTGLTGLTFSSIFIVYEITSIIWVFLATSLIFLVFAIIGKTTNIDLRKFGVFLMVGLFSIIILNIINIFLMNSTMNMTLCILSIILFTGYIAYDIQKITRYYDDTDNMAVVGAFELYLDFINIFIDLLRLFGKERN